MKIKLIGIDEIKKKIKAVEYDKVKINKKLNEVGNYIKNITEQSFEYQRSSLDNTPFKPLSLNTIYKMLEYTKNKKRVKKTSEKQLRSRLILVRTGRLYNSINYKINKNTVTIFTSVKYAAIHQFSGYAGKNNKVFIPARPFFPVDKNNKIPYYVFKKIVDIFNKNQQTL